MGHASATPLNSTHANQAQAPRPVSSTRRSSLVSAAASGLISRLAALVNGSPTSEAPFFSPTGNSTSVPDPLIAADDNHWQLEGSAGCDLLDSDADRDILERPPEPLTAAARPERTSTPFARTPFGFLTGMPSAALATAQFGAGGNVLAPLVASSQDTLRGNGPAAATRRHRREAAARGVLGTVHGDAAAALYLPASADMVPSFNTSYASQRPTDNVEHAVRTGTVTPSADGIRFAGNVMPTNGKPPMSANPASNSAPGTSKPRGRRPSVKPDSNRDLKAPPRHTRANSTRSMDAATRAKSPARGATIRKSGTSTQAASIINSASAVSDPRLHVGTVSQSGNDSDDSGPTDGGLHSVNTGGSEAFGSLDNVINEAPSDDGDGNTPVTEGEDGDGSDVDHQIFASTHHTLPIRGPTRDVNNTSLAPTAGIHTDSFTVDVSLQRGSRSRTRTPRYGLSASPTPSRRRSASQTAADNLKASVRNDLRADNAMPSGDAPAVRFESVAVTESGSKIPLLGSTSPPPPMLHVHSHPQLMGSASGGDPSLSTAFLLAQVESLQRQLTLLSTRHASRSEPDTRSLERASADSEAAGVCAQRPSQGSQWQQPSATLATPVPHSHSGQAPLSSYGQAPSYSTPLPVPPASSRSHRAIATAHGSTHTVPIGSPVIDDSSRAHTLMCPVTTPVSTGYRTTGAPVRVSHYGNPTADQRWTEVQAQLSLLSDVMNFAEHMYRNHLPEDWCKVFYGYLMSFAEEERSTIIQVLGYTDYPFRRAAHDDRGPADSARAFRDTHGSAYQALLEEQRALLLARESLHRRVSHDVPVLPLRPAVTGIYTGTSASFPPPMPLSVQHCHHDQSHQRVVTSATAAPPGASLGFSGSTSVSDTVATNLPAPFYRDASVSVASMYNSASVAASLSPLRVMGGTTTARNEWDTVTGSSSSNASPHHSDSDYDPRSRDAPSAAFFNGVGSLVTRERGGKTYIRLYATDTSPERVILLGSSGVTPDSGSIKSGGFVPRLTFGLEYNRAVAVGISLLSTVDARLVFQDSFMKTWLFDAAVGIDAYDTTNGMLAAFSLVAGYPRPDKFVPWFSELLEGKLHPQEHTRRRVTLISNAIDRLWSPQLLAVADPRAESYPSQLKQCLRLFAEYTCSLQSSEHIEPYWTAMQSAWYESTAALAVCRVSAAPGTFLSGRYLTLVTAALRDVRPVLRFAIAPVSATPTEHKSPASVPKRHAPVAVSTDTHPEDDIPAGRGSTRAAAELRHPGIASWTAKNAAGELAPYCFHFAAFGKCKFADKCTHSHAVIGGPHKALATPATPGKGAGRGGRHAK